MKLREIKAEDIKVGAVVIPRKFDPKKAKSRERVIKSIVNMHRAPLSGVVFTNGGWELRNTLMNHYCLVEIENIARRAVTEEDLVSGAIIKNGNAEHVVHRVSNGVVHYMDGCSDTLNIVLDFFEIEDKPTGIPTFDGDLPQGTKLDSGKVKPSLLLDDMPLAINEILKVLQFGAKKYSEGNWLKVPNGTDRYRNAADRHRLAIDELDDESGMMHLAHEATSALMLLELKLREKRDAE